MKTVYDVVFVEISRTDMIHTEIWSEYEQQRAYLVKKNQLKVFLL